MIPSDLALWRFGIISSLLHRHPEGLTMQEMLDQMTLRQFRLPDNTLRTLSPETLRKWLTRYRLGGLPLLEDQPRSDRGQFQVPPELVEHLVNLCQEHPRWCLSRMFRQLLLNGIWMGSKPSRSALYRYCHAHGLKRLPACADQCRSFAFENFGDLWTADFLHGPRIIVGRQKRKTYIHAILDDATRYLVGIAVFLTEGTEVLIAELKEAVRHFGIPQRFYTDNGAAYRSRHLRLVGARLGIAMPHTPPYRPQGRGKVERLFRSLREQLLDGWKGKDIEKLRADVQEWAKTYHQKHHESLKCSPLERRAATPTTCLRLPETTDLTPLFFMERRCRIYNDGTIRFKRQAYEIPGSTPGQRVTIFYDPTTPGLIWCGPDYQPVRPVNLHRNAHRFNHPPPRKENT